MISIWGRDVNTLGNSAHMFRIVRYVTDPSPVFYKVKTSAIERT